MFFLVCNNGGREGGVGRERERAGCFTLIFILISSCGCKCSVPLPHGTVGLSGVIMAFLLHTCSDD